MDRGPLELELCFCSLLADLEMIPIFEVIADILGNSSQQLKKIHIQMGGLQIFIWTEGSQVFPTGMICWPKKIYNWVQYIIIFS